MDNNISLNNFCNFLQNYRRNNEIIKETNPNKRYRSGVAETSAYKVYNCFDYYMALKNGQLLQEYKRIFGISNEEIKGMIEYYEKGDHENRYGNGNPKVSNNFSGMVKTMSEAVDYDRRCNYDFVRNLVQSVKKYRSDSKRFSLLDKVFTEKTDLAKKWAEVSMQVARDWWSEHHQRTDINIGVYGYEFSMGRYSNSNETKVIKNDKPFVEVDNYYKVQPHVPKGEYDYYKENAIEVPSLWYLNVYRHGMATVVYKNRPCMVVRLKPRPIQRLKDKGFDVYKADIISSKNGVISLVKDLYLVSHKTKAWSKHPEGIQHYDNAKRTFAPHRFDILGESITACNEHLRIAEQTISGRVVSGISKALDI